MAFVTLIVIVLIMLGSKTPHGFVSIPSYSKLASNQRSYTISLIRRRTRSIITMRDHSSSYWFSPGDNVEVIEDVFKAGYNLRGRVGVVTQSWEKCDVDPTCCCAEQVERDLAVFIRFLGTESNSNEQGSFEFGFNESEIQKISLKFLAR